MNALRKQCPAKTSSSLPTSVTRIWCWNICPSCGPGRCSASRWAATRPPASALQGGEVFWNSGIFVGKGSASVEAFRRYLPEHDQLFSGVMRALGTDAEQNVVNMAFSECRAISIDYGIMEKADNVYVRCGDFGWSDVGTWGSVYQHARKDRYANAAPAEGCYLYDTRSSIISLPEKKVAVISGLKEYIVVDTDDVLMICPRSEEQNIKKYIDEVKFHTGEKYV